MLTRVDERLRRQVGEFSLRYACEDCAHFEPGARECSLLYPNEVHLRPRLSDASWVVFCKAFELS